jgi:CRP/FNR family transcriptional regulator, cyclic AMP receptor protein
MLANARQTAELVEVFRRHGTEHTYKKGEYIIRPGESPPGVFYIQEGLVRAYDITRYGEENMLIVRKSHEIFPLIWALTGQERDVIYQALAPTTVWRLDRTIFEERILADTPALAPLLDMTIEMYRLHSERILNLEYRSVRERIVSFLLTMAQRFGEETEDGVVIAVPLRHQDIASSINASRETTSREIAGLERRALLRNGQGLVTLLDVPALQALLG